MRFSRKAKFQNRDERNRLLILVTFLLFTSVLQSDTVHDARDRDSDGVTSAQCSQCHSFHNASEGGEAPLQKLDVNNYICLNCHSTGGQATVTTAQWPAAHSDYEITKMHRADGAVKCLNCHTPHPGETTNIRLIRGSDPAKRLIVPFGPGVGEERTVIFNSRGSNATVLPGSVGSFADNNAAGDGYTGICEVCHYSSAQVAGSLTPTFNQEGYNSASNPGGSDMAPGLNCTGCHSHQQGGQAWQPTGGSCIGCHSKNQKSTADPLSPLYNKFRRAAAQEIADAEAAGTGHHVWSGTATDWDCVVCHREGDINTADPTDLMGDGKIDLRNPDTQDDSDHPDPFWSLTRDRTSSALESWVSNVMHLFCLKCHDDAGAEGYHMDIIDAAANNDPEVSTPLGTFSAMQPFSSERRTRVPSIFELLNPNSNGLPLTSPNRGKKSFHPIRGTNPNDNASMSTRMVTPWNDGKDHLISCFDCHGTEDDSQIANNISIGHGTTMQRMTRKDVDGAPSQSIDYDLLAWPGIASTANLDSSNGAGCVEGTHACFNTVGQPVIDLCLQCHSTDVNDSAWGASHDPTNTNHAANTIGVGCHNCHASPGQLGADSRSVAGGCDAAGDGTNGSRHGNIHGVDTWPVDSKCNIMNANWPEAGSYTVRSFYIGGGTYGHDKAGASCYMGDCSHAGGNRGY